MKTGKEMLKWFKVMRKVSRSNYNDTQYLKLFNKVEENLDPDEEVKVAFIGTLGNSAPYFHFFWHYWGTLSAIALTDQGLIIVNSKGFILKKVMIKTIKVEFLNDISKEDRIFFTTLNIDTVKENVNITLRKEDAKDIFTTLRAILIVDNDETLDKEEKAK